MWKWALIAFLGALCTVLLIGSNYEGRPMSQRIEEACRSEFAAQGDEAVTRCRTEISSRYVQDQERDRLNSAYERVR
jgi:hypothetical protein